jgi:hypothetical protein
MFTKSENNPTQSIKMCHDLTPKFPSPATAALERSLKMASSTPFVNKTRPARMISFKPRPRASSLGSFNITSLVEASQSLEAEVDFPSIEWSKDIKADSSSRSDDSAEYTIGYPAPKKRKRRGLVRSYEITSGLSSLATSSARMASFNSPLCYMSE